MTVREYASGRYNLESPVVVESRDGLLYLEVDLLADLCAGMRRAIVILAGMTQ